MRMTRLVGALVFLMAAPISMALWAQDDAPPIRRALDRMTLGETLKDVQRLYPPAKDWPSSVEKRTGVKRLRLERASAKSFPEHVQVLWLGFKAGRLVEIQLIYDLAFTRKKAVESLAEDLSLVYGEPRHSGDKFWWADRKTVLRVFDARIPVSKGKIQAVELHTAIQILEAYLFRYAG